MRKLKKFAIFLVILIFLFITCIYLLKTLVYKRTYFDIIKKEAKINNIDPYLLLAVIKTESGFNKFAVSDKKAKGLMQIMDSTAKDITGIEVDNIYEEKTNISVGCRYLSRLINRYNGNYYLAICAYNAGMGNVDRWISTSKVDKNLDEYINVKLPFKETSNYLENVIKSYKMYRILYK